MGRGAGRGLVSLCLDVAETDAGCRQGKGQLSHFRVKITDVSLKLEKARYFLMAGPLYAMRKGKSRIERVLSANSREGTEWLYFTHRVNIL